MKRGVHTIGLGGDPGVSSYFRLADSIYRFFVTSSGTLRSPPRACASRRAPVRQRVSFSPVRV